MAYQPPPTDIWEGFEPEPPRPPAGRNRGWLWLAGGAILLLGLGGCLLGLFFFLPGGLGGPEATPTLFIPGAGGSATGGSATGGSATGGSETGGATAIAPTLVPGTLGPAPTVTLAAATAPAAPTAPPEGQVSATRLSGPPAIDGDLGDWPAISPVSSAFRVFQTAGWDGTQDLEALWRLGWDDSRLYIGVQVSDDRHVQTQTGNQIFRGDSLDMQIDTDPQAGASRVNPRTFQIIFSPGNFGSLPPSAFRFQGTEAGQVLDAAGHGIQVAARQTAGGYILEAAIPWSDLNVAPAAGLELGLALNANDNDTPDTAVQEVMMSHVSTRLFLDPSSWGRLVLE